MCGSFCPAVPSFLVTGGLAKPPSKEPLDINNLLLRGCILRKTDWVIGLAINVGNDSKIVQNMTKAPRKVGGSENPPDEHSHPATCGSVAHRMSSLHIAACQMLSCGTTTCR